MTTLNLRSALDAWTDAARDPDDRGTSLALLQAAEHAIAKCAPTADVVWHRYLDETRLPRFLKALPDHDHRCRWALSAVSAVKQSGFTLEALLDQRASRHPRRVFLQSPDDLPGTGWTFAQVRRHVRRLAAFALTAVEHAPRVAIFAANGMQSACCDLACLAYDILDTPIPLHSDLTDLVSMFDEVGYDLAFTDTDTRYRTLQEVRRRARKPFRILRLDADAANLERGDEVLASGYAHFGEDHVAQTLESRPRLEMDDAATVMFTPGADGHPKAVVFSQLNLVSKRFARAAALPDVGENEVLFCFLPLFHTFGRFLELLGMLFWGGTYAFAGNPSTDTLMAGLKRVRPTGLVSVPVRWMQLHKACLASAATDASPSRDQAFRAVTGGRLRWGLSAAGYLSPDVFRFFHANGVALCSGFGITEATGGVTMTPPDDYRDGSVGIPLPAIDVRLSEVSELQIRGPYVARHALASPSASEPPWIPTGDLFRVRDDGHYEIYDRIKDIYKNSRGQTVAPRRVEQAFDGVPGVRRAFLAGDLRDDNTLLLFPDATDDSREEQRARLHAIVLEANRKLALHERVVDFAIIERDLSEDLGELAADGSYRRKMIATSFKSEIEAMYGDRQVELSVGALVVRIPRWLFRDLGILISDIVAEPGGLLDRSADRRLCVEPGCEPGWIRVGGLEYRMEGARIDLGAFARQPLLWAGNPSLAAFCPSKDGWDVPLGSIAETIRPACPRGGAFVSTTDVILADPMLREVHALSASALLDTEIPARAAVRRLALLLTTADSRVAALIRLRLEALASHALFPLRADAYRALLVAGPEVRGRDASVTFLRSGLPFLDEPSLLTLCITRLERRPLETLRRQLRRYRLGIDTSCAASLAGIRHVLEALASLGRRHRFAWEAARAELATWALLCPDVDLARTAERLLASLHRPFVPTRCAAQRGWLASVLSDTDLLAQSVSIANGRSAASAASGFTTLTVMRVGRDGTARWSAIDERAGRVDLLIAPHTHTPDDELDKSLRWHAAIHGFPFGTAAALPAGLWRAKPRAVCSAYVDAPNAWERIATIAEERNEEATSRLAETWRAVFVGAMAAVFRAWLASDRNVVPATLHPGDVLLPFEHLDDCAVVSGRTGWRDYPGAVAFADELARAFLLRAADHHPRREDSPPLRWVLDAAVEAMDRSDAAAWFEELGRDATWAARVKDYAAADSLRSYVPLAVQSAVRLYADWHASVPEASAQAREHTVLGLHRCLGVDRFDDAQRYRLYRETYFADAMPPVRDALDLLIAALERAPQRRAPELVELSDLQAILARADDRMVLRNLVFPTAAPIDRLDALLADAKSSTLHVHVRAGEPYALRSATSSEEVLAAFRILAAANPVRSIWSDETLRVVADRQQHIVGCLLHARGVRGDVAFDAPSLHPRLGGEGLQRELVHAFCQQAVADGARTVRARVAAGKLVEPMGFAPHPRWGELVRR